MSSIRVNPNILPDLLSSLAETRQQQETATMQLATGSRINQRRTIQPGPRRWSSIAIRAARPTLFYAASAA